MSTPGVFLCTLSGQKVSRDSVGVDEQWGRRAIVRVGRSDCSLRAPHRDLTKYLGATQGWDSNELGSGDELAVTCWVRHSWLSFYV